MVKYVNISVPKPLYERLSKVLEGTGFRSPTEYILYIVRKNLAYLEARDVKERLRALGYET